MKFNTMEDLYVHSLKDMYNAEKQLVKALPKLAKGAKHPELKEAFNSHLEETKEHVSRLEQILEELNKRSAGVVCHAMKGLIDEARRSLRPTGRKRFWTRVSSWRPRRWSTTRSGVTGVWWSSRGFWGAGATRACCGRPWMRRRRRTRR